MPLEARLFVGLAIAVAVVHLTTPLAIRLAERFEFYDRPVGYKGHAAPTPYLGGAAVVAGFLAALVLLAGSWDRTLPLVAGVVVLWALGTVDDRRTVRPLTRVVVEAGLGAGLWALGLGWDLGAGAALDLALSAFWIVAVVNAFNLFDNMDGAASSMAAVVAAGLSLLGVVEGDTWLAVTGAALCGAAVGFLPHNLFASPARIFLGDGGSMPIGFAVAATAMIGVSGAAAAWQSLAMGLLFVGIPALDTTLVTISRRRRGLSVLTGGRDHLTHRARARLRTARAVAVTLGGAQAVISALAVVALTGGSTSVVLAVIAYLVGLGAAIVVLDARFEDAPATVSASSAATTRATGDGPALILLIPLAAGIGISPFFFGYYDPTIWVPAGLALLGVATAGLIARPPRLELPAKLLLAAIAGLGILALISAAWGDSIEQAVVEGNRWLAYAALLTVLLVLVRTDRTALAMLATLAVCALGVGLYLLVSLTGAGAPDLFLGGRLHEPLGYINGIGGYLLLGTWLCLAGAERREPVIAALGAGGATLLGGLLLLTQSRGVALAAAVSLAVVFLLVPGRTRRGWACIIVGAALALAVPALLDVYELRTGATVDAGVANRAAQWLAITSAASAAVWGLASWALAQTPVPRVAGRAASGVLVAGLVVALVVGLASAGRVADTVERQYDAFVSLGADTGGSSRLVTGAGNRYDYWRVAWRAFEDAPLHGIGAGNFDRAYFAGRTTAEDIRQPHSIELQFLSELGVFGAVLLALVLAAAGWGAARLTWRARTAPDERTIAVAAFGIAVAWLVHTSVDWLHLLPGITAIAAVAAACLVRTPGSEQAGRARLLPIVTALAITVAAVSLTRQALTERFVDRARAALQTDPAQALREADRALRLDGEALGAYYVKSAALARFGEGVAARTALEEAARREPGEYVTWALLGDLAVRSGDIEGARAHYERAQRINPREPSLPPLVADPRAALSSP